MSAHLRRLMLAAGGIWLSLAALAAADAPAPRVGIFDSTGAQGMRAALAAAGMAAEILTDLEAETLFRHDVIVLGSVKGLPYRRWENALKLFAQCGGGVLLSHDATGFRGWTDSLFPDLFKGTARARSKQAAVVLPDHPLNAGVPGKFPHGYFDHVLLEARAAGTVVLADAENQPLAVCGAAGQGRVLGCGMIIGFAEVDGQGQGEQAPAGGELQFLLNAVNWLGENALTRLPPAELAARRNRLENALALQAAAQVAAEEAADAKQQSDRRKDWFAESMMSEQVFVHPPVEILPGRFFMFEGVFVSVVGRHGVGREYGEIVGILRQLKWLGVTDIITHSGGPVVNFRYLSKLPDISFSSYAKGYGFDYLEVLLKACRAVGLNVWGFWHPVCKEGGEAYHIHDGRGKAYAKYLDIKNPALLERCRQCIDELAERYNVHGNFKGIFLDELWHAFIYDRMEGETGRFADFCRQRFGEAPPAELDLAAKFALGREWHDPADVWWRRYALFRNTFTVDYIRAVTAYANAKGLQIMPQIGFGFDWYQGHGDTYNLARAGNILWSYELRNNSRYEQYPRDRVICATHTRLSNGYQCLCLIRGGWGSQFAMEQTWLPVTYGLNPRAPLVLQRQILANREWFGAKPLTRIAVLSNRLGLDLQFRNAGDVFKENEEAVQRALGTAWPAAMLLTQDAEYFDRYKVLIAPKYSLNCLAEAEYAALTRFVEGGGSLILLDGEITTARADHTGLQNRTLEFAGFERAAAMDGLPQKIDGALKFAGRAATTNDPVFAALAPTPVKPDPGRAIPVVSAAAGAAPIVTETSRGKGKILAVHCDLAALLNTPDSAAPALELLRILMARIDRPPITLTGDLLAITAVQKGNWVAVTMLSRDAAYTSYGGQEYPARGRLFVNMPDLGVAAEKYRVYTLARDRELMPQTPEDVNVWGRQYWTAEMLSRDGVPVYIPPDSLQDLELPYAGKDEYIRKYILPKWDRAPRRMEHEIIAIAPAGEGCMAALPDQVER